MIADAMLGALARWLRILGLDVAYDPALDDPGLVERAVAEFGGPVLLMHGLEDEVISYRHAETVASARPGLAVTRIPCRHNDCLLAWPSIVDALTSFLRTHGLLTTTRAGTVGV